MTEAARPQGFAWWMMVVSLFAGNGSAALIYDALPPVLAQLSAHFGGGEYGDMIGQWASSLPMGGIIVGGILAGSIIERFGVRMALLIGLIGFGVFGSAGLWINDAIYLLVSRAVLGVAVGIQLTCCTSLVAHYFHGEERALMAGRLVGVGAVAGVSFILVAGFAATLAGWRAPFALHGVWMALMVGPAWFISRDIVFNHQKFSWSERLAALSPMLPVFLVTLGVYILSGLFNVQLAFLVAAAGISGPTVIATIFALAGASVAVFSLMFGRIELLLGPDNAIRVGMLSLAAGYVVAAMATTLPVYWASAILYGAGIGLVAPGLWTIGMARTPSNMVPHAMGIMTSAIYLGGSFGPLIILPIRSVVGLHGQYFVAAGVLMAAMIVQMTRARSGRAAN